MLVSKELTVWYFTLAISVEVKSKHSPIISCFYSITFVVMVVILIATLGEWGAQFNLLLKIILCLISPNFVFFVSPWTVLSMEYFCSLLFLSTDFLSRHPDTQEESGCLVFWVWVQRRPVVFRTLSYRRTERCWSSSSTPSSTATNTVCVINRVELKKLSRHSFTKLTHFTVQCVYRAAVRPHYHWYYTRNVFYTMVWT